MVRFLKKKCIKDAWLLALENIISLLLDYFVLVSSSITFTTSFNNWLASVPGFAKS